MFPRLGQLAGAFQRIKYHRLRFEVVTGLPSDTSGVYVAGFIRDATDPVKAKTASSTLLASGGVATKWWQSCDVVVTGLPDLYYTSSAPTSTRWASPGSFVISIIGKPSQGGSLEVFCHWDVSLSSPTYEGEAETGAGYTSALADMYTAAGGKHLQKRAGSGWADVTALDFSPPLVRGQVLECLAMKFADTKTGSGTYGGLFGFRNIMMNSDGKVVPVDEKGSLTDESFYNEVYVLFKGEKWEILTPPNIQLASWFLSANPQYRTLYEDLSTMSLQ